VFGAKGRKGGGHGQCLAKECMRGGGCATQRDGQAWGPPAQGATNGINNKKNRAASSGAKEREGGNVAAVAKSPPSLSPSLQPPPQRSKSRSACSSRPSSALSDSERFSCAHGNCTTNRCVSIVVQSMSPVDRSTRVGTCWLITSCRTE